jgi:hypothetical protein
LEHRDQKIYITELHFTAVKIDDDK